MRLFIYPIIPLFLLISVGCTGLNDEIDSSLEEPAPLTIALNREVSPQQLELQGLPEPVAVMLQEQPLSQSEWQTVFAIAVDEAQPPMLGRYVLEPQMIRFEPAFPLTAGLRYQATFLPSELVKVRPTSQAYLAESASIVETFEIPLPDDAPTLITGIYPSADQLPANMLRFYVYFSAPMREGDALEHVALINAAGEEIEGVFFDPIFELWDPSRQRLTLLFDPGRVKTGLQAHEDLGRALVPGQAYTLRIKASMPDANNTPLGSEYEKLFRATEPDLIPPDIETWTVTPPVAGGIDPLIVQFEAPLDHQLLTEFVQIQTADGENVPGTIQVSRDETEWQFRPDQSWEAGIYDLRVNTKLEDIAGNNLHGLFDIPPEDRLNYQGQSEARRMFQVK